MVDESKVQFDIELNEGSVEASFKTVDERAAKSAKESAAVFGAHFQRMENELKDSLNRIVKESGDVSRKSAKESAKVFEAEFKKHEEIYKASVKHSLDQAIAAITGSDRAKKSAKESAAVFEEGFRSGVLKGSIFDEIKNLFSSGFKVGGLADLAGGFFLLREAVNGAQFAIKKTFDTILLGESEIKLENKFRTLATEAGLAADVLQNDLIKATRGLVDEGKLLNLASESFIQLGRNASRLPEIIELARKTYATFGGSIVENAEKINAAIFSGNTRQLRQLGILVDAEKTYKEYARTLGTVAPLLTEQQRQQAILNEILSQGQERFKNINSSTGPLTESMARLRVTTQNLIDDFSILASTTIGGLLAKAIDSVSSSINGWDRIFKAVAVDRMPEGIDKLRAKIQTLSDSITEGEKRLDSFGKTEMRTLAPTIREGIESKRVELAKLTLELERATKAQGALNASQAPTGADTGVDTSTTEFLNRKRDLVAKVQELNNQVNASELRLAQQQFERQRTSANLEALNTAQRLNATQTFLQQKAQLEKFFEDNGVQDAVLRNQAREALEMQHALRLKEIRQGYVNEVTSGNRMVEESEVTAGNAFSEMAKGMKANGDELRKNFNANFRSMGQAARDGIGQATGNAFAAFGAALVNGENALEAFAKAFIGSIGQQAIASGTRFIVEGLAWLTVPGFQAEGAAMISAGAALATFGGALTAFAGSGSGGVGNAKGGGGISGAGGGVAGEQSPITDVVAPEELEAQIPKTEVSITIQGNVLDRRESGLEIAKILEEQFSEQGLVLKGA